MRFLSNCLSASVWSCSQFRGWPKTKIGKTDGPADNNGDYKELAVPSEPLSNLRAWAGSWITMDAIFNKSAPVR